MKTLLHLIFLCSGFLIYNGYAQTSDFYAHTYFPSQPYGGEEEIQRLVKQEIVYPEAALENDIEGSIFINFVIDDKGEVIYKEIIDNELEILGREAEIIFDKILWLPNKSEIDPKERIEKVRIDFNIKKYKKLIKKRGYDKLPVQEVIVDTDFKYYSINQVDEKPEIKNYESINEFVKEHFKFPTVALQRGVSGIVIAEFIIEPYGKASNIRIKKPLAGGCNDEMKRLIRLTEWKPAMKNKQAVRTIYEYQLNFVHPGGTVNGSY